MEKKHDYVIIKKIYPRNVNALFCTTIWLHSSLYVWNQNLLHLFPCCRGSLLPLVLSPCAPYSTSLLSHQKLKIWLFNPDVFPAFLNDHWLFFQMNPPRHPCKEVMYIERNVIIAVLNFWLTCCTQLKYWCIWVVYCRFGCVRWGVSNILVSIQLTTWIDSSNPLTLSRNKWQ